MNQYPYYYGTAQNIGVPSPYGYGAYQPMPNANYMNNNYQAQSQQVQQAQSQNNQAPVQQVFLPLTNVNSVEEVNRFIVPINQSVYFRLNNDNKMYLKSTDIKGVSTIEEFELVKSNSKNQETKTNQNVEYATKQDFNELVGALAEFRKTILSEMKIILNEPKNASEKEVIRDVK